MAESSGEDLASLLYKWAYQEMFFHPQGAYANTKPPTEQDFREMCRGPAIDIWGYIIRHVYSTQTVRKVKGNLALKKREKPDEYQVEYGGAGRYCEEMRSLEEQKTALSSQVSHLLSDIRHLQAEQTRLHTELINTESSYETSTSRIRDNRRKAMLLRIYSEKCAVEAVQSEDFSHRLASKAQKICCKTRKKSEEAYFTKESAEGRKGSETEIETACCKCVRESCNAIGKFLHEVLQGSFGNDRTVFHRRKDQLWSSVEDVLSDYPIAQVLQALMVCTQDSIIHIQEKTAAINIRKDAERLQFKYENTGALVDLSSKGNVLQGLHELQEVCQSRHIQRFFETEKNKNEAWRLGQQTDSIMSKIDKQLQKQFQGKSKEIDAARKVIESKLELASLKSALSCYQEEGKKLQSSIQKATKHTELLMLKYRKIQDFKELAQKKQQLIRILVRQNSNSFSRLASQRSEIVEYVDRSLSGHREQIVAVVDRYQGAIQREVEKFASLSLPYLLHVWLDSVTKVAGLDMCIHQIERGPTTTAGKTLLQTMAALKYPVFKAPEYLLLRCVEVKSEIEEMESLLRYHDNQGQHLTQSLHDKNDMLTYMNDLCERVRTYDKSQLDEVLPVLNKHIDQATRGLADCLQLKDTVRDWWEQPAQYTVPWLKVDNMNIQQWKDKWTVVSTGIRQAQT